MTLLRDINALTAPAIRSLLVTGLLITTAACSAKAEPPAEFGALAKMPVREVTVFKDGNAFVAHQGKMPTDAHGNVLLDYLPTPVLGTFWPYSADPAIKLTAVTSSTQLVRVERTALTLLDLISSNPNTEVLVTEVDGKSYRATLLGIPERSGDEQERTSPPNTGPFLPISGEVVLLKTEVGTAVVPKARIQNISFINPPRKTVGTEEFRHLLTIKFDWPNGKPQKSADVGMVYLQRGFRWIPSYKVDMDGKGNARVLLQATLINELTDLDDVTVNLVIGVPSFALKDVIDPIGLQTTLAQLSPLFDNNSAMSNSVSNGMMSQVMGQQMLRNDARGNRGGLPGEGAADLGPTISDAGKNEDTFLFTVQHVSLKKGQRMVLPVTEMALKYQDLYTVNIPMSPPVDVRTRSGLNPSQVEALKLQNAPHVEHLIRLTNGNKYPLTTAPALILSNGKVLSQNMLYYTPTKGQTDLKLTTAIDIGVKKSEKETGRIPNAANWQGDAYMRVDLAGNIRLTNYLASPVEVEITRNLLGQVTSVDKEGKINAVNLVEDDGTATGGDQPVWWGWYNWPAGWSHLNGIGRIVWKVKLEPNKPTELNYNWRYFWR